MIVEMVIEDIGVSLLMVVFENLGMVFDGESLRFVCGCFLHHE